MERQASLHLANIKETEERFQRLAHLPARPEVKIVAIVVGCFSLFSFALFFFPSFSSSLPGSLNPGPLAWFPGYCFSLFPSSSLDLFFQRL